VDDDTISEDLLGNSSSLKQSQAKNVFNAPSDEDDDEYLDSGAFEEDNLAAQGRNNNVKLPNKKGSTEQEYENDFE
jgi:hypothetical protein